MSKKDFGPDHMAELEKQWGEILANDKTGLWKKEGQYKGSWKKRGGTGAFMMLARKWDRIEETVTEQYHDIFESLEKEFNQNGYWPADGLMDDIRDLRRYLVLVENEMIQRMGNAKQSEDPI